jgi:pre-mRNA-splicing factor CWC22
MSALPSFVPKYAHNICYSSSPSRSLGRDRSPPTQKRRSNSPSIGMHVDKETPVPSKPQDPAFDARAEFAKLTAGTRSGGVYMPPARLRALQAEAAKDKTSAEYQRLSWDALRKSITGIVNRVNILNIKSIVPELFNENLIRGKGLFARSIMKAQAASLPFTPVFACLVAIVNTKLPSVGELVLIRLVSQFRRSFKRNDKVRLSISC